MAGKRSASTNLNHENWDQEDDPEDAGMFQKASEDSLKKRIIKTARRRNPISSVRSADEEEKKSAFTGFTAFSKASTSAAQFSFLSNMTSQNEQSKSNGVDKDSKDNDITTPISNTLFGATSANTSINSKSNGYYAKLKGLNESVSQWIKKHVDSNPFINLQPIFRDYEKYFKELESEKEKSSSSDSAKSGNSKKDDNIQAMSNFLFKVAKNVPDSTTEKPQVEASKIEQNSTPKFSFGSAITSSEILGNKSSSVLNSTSTMASTNTFSFGSNIVSKVDTASTLSFGSFSKPTSTGFTFSSSTPFSMNSVTKPTSAESKSKENESKSNETEANQDDEDGPPKVEFTPVVEKDHIYTIRCKVFVKKDDTFTDRGVGNLFLKPIENSEKVQLIVRADTNLGNLLCNFILSSSIPMQRVGKRDVMLICLPTPDFKPPPVPIRLRVKTPDDASNLLKTLEDHKK